MDSDLQRHVRQGYLWDWGRTALAPQPRDQCPGWPRAVPCAGPRPLGASRTAAASSGAPPCGMETHTWASSCITSGASPSQSASATEGATPPLKGAGLLACKPTPPSAAAAPRGLKGAEPFEREISRTRPPRLPKAKAWQGPGRESGGGGSP